MTTGSNFKKGPKGRETHNYQETDQNPCDMPRSSDKLTAEAHPLPSTAPGERAQAQPLKILYLYSNLTTCLSDGLLSPNWLPENQLEAAGTSLELVISLRFI